MTDEPIEIPLSHAAHQLGVSWHAAYRLVQRHAMRAWDEGLDFRSLVRGDPEIAALIEEEIARPDVR